MSQMSQFLRRSVMFVIKLLYLDKLVPIRHWDLTFLAARPMA